MAINGHAPGVMAQDLAARVYIEDLLSKSAGTVNQAELQELQGAIK